MGLDNERSATVYSGNGSTSVPYPVGFDYLSAAHVRVQVTLAAGTVLELGNAAYTVAADGVRTVEAYAAGDTVRIYRLVPLTQPLSLPLAGALSPAAIERNFDWVVQQIQQLARSIDGTGTGLPIGSGNALEDTALWDDPAGRLAVRPKRIGQLGVELSTQTIWIAQSTVPGDWEEFSPRQDIAQSLVILATADAGIPGTLQSQIVALAQLWSVDGVLAIGDNRYDPYSHAAAWAAFAPLIAAQKVYPAKGNHDYLDWTADEALFSYLPPNPSGHRRYYSNILGNGLLGLITLHSGYGHAGTVIEPDGVAVGSVQHAWFVATLAAMENAGVRWIVVQMHHPVATVSDETNRAFPALLYPEFSRVHGVFCGHVHLNEWLSVRGVPMVNVSGCIQKDGHVSYGVGIAGAHEQTELLWVDDRTPLVARLQISPDRFLVQFCEPSTGRVRYQRSLSDSTSERACWDRELIAPTEAVPVGGIYMGLSPSVIRRAEFFIGVRETAGSPLQGTIVVDGVVAANWTIPAGHYYVEVNSTWHVRRGAAVVCIVENNAAYPAWLGLQLAVRGLLCS